MQSALDSGHVTADLLNHETISSWLRKHGKSVRPRLDKRQLNALRECFDIIDTDGTGTITAEELQEVFTVPANSLSKPAALQRKQLLPHSIADACKVSWQALGNHVSLQAVAHVLDGVKHRGSIGIGFPDFIDIMTRDSDDLAHDGYRASNSSATTAYNIALMARAYRCTSLYQSHAHAPISLGHKSHYTKLCSSVCGMRKTVHVYGML